MKQILIWALMFILSMIFMLPLMVNSMLDDYQYSKHAMKYPFRLRARTSFLIGIILFIISFFFI